MADGLVTRRRDGHVLVITMAREAKRNAMDRELADALGEPIGAERAHAAGFVNVLTEPGRAVDGAVALAHRIARNAPLSVQACLAAVNAQLAPGIEAGWVATEAAKQAILDTDDAAEGVRSFLEKRPPEWKAR